MKIGSLPLLDLGPIEPGGVATMAVVKNDNPTRDRLKPGAGKSISQELALLINSRCLCGQIYWRCSQRFFITGKSAMVMQVELVCFYQGEALVTDRSFAKLGFHSL